MTKDLTQGNPFSVLLKFVLPVIGGNLFQLFYTLADTIIVGRTLGANALAAVGSTGIISYFVLCFIQGITGGFGICIGQHCGAHDEIALRRSAALSWVLTAAYILLVTPLACLLTDPLLQLLNTPADIFHDSHTYLLIILLGTGATAYYNLISNMLRALGDSRTPLIFLVLSSLLNIVLDIVLIVPCGMGVAGAAWATVWSQLLSAILCTVAGVRQFPGILPNKAAFERWQSTTKKLLQVGFPMGFQMSVMCIGQVAMQAAVNALGASAVAGYTAATKVDQISVLLNNAFSMAISNYVAQNYGAGQYGRIREGMQAGLFQAEATNLLLCTILLAGRNVVPALFVEAPTAEVIGYSNGYLLAVAPFYLLLGLLAVIRSTIQSMGNGAAPFMACIIELVVRIGATFGLSRLLGYTGICLATPLAWSGAVLLLLVTYRNMMQEYMAVS